MRPHRTVTPNSRLRRSTASILTMGAGALIVAGAASGCSVLYDLSTEQCSTTADCVALGGVFETLECRENLCQEPIIGGCLTNAQCIDEAGSGVEPYACIQRNCVRLRSDECPLVLPVTNDLGLRNLRSDADGKEPLILAGTGLFQQNPFDDYRIRNYELALTEVTSAAGGIQLGQRPLVMVGCDSVIPEDQPEILDNIMTHVVDDLKIPGMVTAFLADDLQNAWLNTGQAADTFFISAQDSDPTLASLPDQGLMWHVVPGADTVAWTYAPLLARTLAHLGLASATDVRVATVVDTNERFLATTLTTIESPIAEHGISFNGKSAAENRTDGNYRSFSVSAANLVQELVAWRPHVIISAAVGEFYTNVITGVERDWGATDTQPKPFYLLSAYNFNDTPRLANVLTASASVRTRLAGVNVAAAEDSTLYQTYTGAWDTAFGDMLGVRGYENFYDAAYYLIYAAAAAARNTDVSSGANLGAGMTALLEGPPRNVGYAGVSSALQALAIGSIELNGTMGPPDFNRLNGTRQTAGSVWCVDPGPTFVADVLRFSQSDPEDATTATLTGTFPSTCISDF